MDDPLTNPIAALERAELEALAVQRFESLLFEQGFDPMPHQKFLRLLAAYHPQIAPNDANEIRAQKYLAARLLYRFHCWSEPWISLYRKEFGAVPTPDDRALILYELQELYREKVQIEAAIATIRPQMIVQLVINNYTCSIRDLSVVDQLCLLVRLVSLRPKPINPCQQTANRLQAKLLVARSSHPDHPSWQAVLERYFPLPAEP